MSHFGTWHVPPVTCATVTPPALAQAFCARRVPLMLASYLPFCAHTGGMSHNPLAEATIRESRGRLAKHLVELHRLHLLLANEARSMKAFSFDGRAHAEIEVASEMLEQYLASSNAFLENMRGRFDARLALLRRGEPVANGNREDAPGHAEFWLAFSRLTAVLRRVSRCAEV
jgi:hypothetical protein